MIKFLNKSPYITSADVTRDKLPLGYIALIESSRCLDREKVRSFKKLYINCVNDLFRTLLIVGQGELMPRPTPLHFSACHIYSNRSPGVYISFPAVENQVLKLDQQGRCLFPISAQYPQARQYSILRGGIKFIHIKEWDIP